jgi:hypothetical protein
MAEPLGIIGVVGVVTQLIQIGAQFGLDWKDAPAEAKCFILELKTLKAALTETNENIVLSLDFKNALRG